MEAGYPPTGADLRLLVVRERLALPVAAEVAKGIARGRRHTRCKGKRVKRKETESWQVGDLDGERLQTVTLGGEEEGRLSHL
jgi:hypothetical protein